MQPMIFLEFTMADYQFPAPESAITKTSTDQSGNESKANDSLSKAMFENPVGFLSVLRARFSSIASLPGEEMTKNDLLIYSQNATNDPKGKAAAEIALSHFDQLTALTQEGRDLRLEKADGAPLYASIDARDLQTDLDLYQNKVQSMVVWDEIFSGTVAAITTAATAGLGTLTVASIECPPVSAAFAVATAISGAGLAYTVNNMRKAP